MAKDKLTDYAAKRSFGATPEPAPAPLAPRKGPLLFVLQQHAARRMHYDLRLECDGVLKSWAVPRGPSLDPSEKRLAVQTEDHPYEYGSFEGVIPPGQYGAGEMIVWDCGVYSPDEGGEYWFHDHAAAERRVREGLEKGKLGFFLRGEKVKGSFALVRMADRKNWLLIKHKDRFVGTTDLTAIDRSVLSASTLDDVKTRPLQRLPVERLVPSGPAEALPASPAPMHAELGEAPSDHPDWMWEPKLDGYRALAFISEKGVTLKSRRGLALDAFPHLEAELARQAVNTMVLDGELVAFDAAGKPSFNAMQNVQPNTPVVFYCFDLLHFAGLNLRKAPYQDRRRWLAQCLLPSPLVQLVHASEQGKALHQAALESGLEGVIGKHKASLYEAGKRSSSWLKVKATQSGEFVVGGYTRGKGSRAPFGALLLGYWEGGKLRYASHVGSGFDDATLAQAKKRLEPLRRDTWPFAEKPELPNPTTWVEPKVVAEVKFQNWTDEGSLRAPVFLRFRDDIAPKEVRRTKAKRESKDDSEIGAILRQLDNTKSALTLAVGKHPIKLTHLDRVYWPADPALKQPALTKRDLLRYFAETITVFSDHKDESHEYLLCNNLPTLLWLAQSGTLEFHVWHSRAKVAPDAATKATDYASSLESLQESVLNYPDYVVFDIDPYIYSGKEAPGDEPELNNVAFEKGKEVAFRLRELLNSMALEPIVKTSGKTGLHVFLPINRTIDFDAARQVSEFVGRHLMRLHPKDITLEWSVPKRTGKIFMDYNMNVRGKTLNAAYSPRGAPGAPVSMPLTWEELAGAHPLDFRITNAAQRLAETGDRWHDVLRRKQSLERALDRAKA